MKREKLPELVQSYLRILEGQVPAEELRGLLARNVRWSGDAKNYIEGTRAVCAHIEGWLSTVEDTQIKMIRMTDQGDCVKVNFIIHTTLVQNARAVELLIIAMYMIEDGKLSELFEHWPQIPPDARGSRKKRW